MESSNFSVHKLETHPTKDVSDSHVNGELTVVWRDWDDILPNPPKMVYLNTVNSHEIKGPHLHKNRTTHFCCIEGNLVLIIKDGEKFHEIKIDAKNPSLVTVKYGIPAAILNPTSNVSRVLVLADIAWKPNDNEMMNVDFENYDFQKWNNSN